MSGEKRHAPSQKRLDRARKEGRSCKSQILSASIAVITCFICTFLLCKFILVSNKILLEYVLTSGFNQPLKLVSWAGGIVAGIVLAGLSMAMLSGLLIEVIQNGFRFNVSSSLFRPERLNLVAGIGNIWKSITQSWQMLIRLTLFSLVFYWLFWRLVQTVLQPSGGRTWFLRVFQSQFLWLLAAAGLALLLSGLLEYALNRRQFMQQLRMSDQELRDEQREDHGDPMIRAMRQAQQRELHRQDMVRRVRSCRVIIVEKT